MVDDTKREQELTFFSAKYCLGNLHICMMVHAHIQSGAGVMGRTWCLKPLRMRELSFLITINLRYPDKIDLHPSAMNLLRRVYEFWPGQILQRIYHQLTSQLRIACQMFNRG